MFQPYKKCIDYREKNYGCIDNTVFTSDPNNRVIKRLWCISMTFVFWHSSNILYKVYLMCNVGKMPLCHMRTTKVQMSVCIPAV